MMIIDFIRLCVDSNISVLQTLWGVKICVSLVGHIYLQLPPENTFIKVKTSQTLRVVFRVPLSKEVDIHDLILSFIYGVNCLISEAMAS